MKYRVFYKLGMSLSLKSAKCEDIELATTEKANEATFKSKLGLSSNDVVLSWSLIEED